MISWLPHCPDFSGELRAALEATSDAERYPVIRRLANSRLDYVQTIQLDRAIQWHDDGNPETGDSTRIALLASTISDHLLPAVRVACCRYGIRCNLFNGAYAQYRQLVLDPSSDFHRFEPDLVVFSLTARELLANLPFAAKDGEVAAYVESFVQDVVSLWRAVRESTGATVIQQTYLNVGDTLFGNLDASIGWSPVSLVRTLNDRMIRAARNEGVRVLDLSRSVEQYGLSFWFDNAKWLQAKMEVSPNAAVLYGELLARLIAAHLGLSRKCLVVDLDNTLWGGVVGDDGTDALVLGEGSAPGEAFKAFQQYLRLLARRGVILGVCSKNDMSTALSAFEGHPEMVLKKTDIADFVANWDDKASNLQSIAQRLNIGLDSLVFVDDNPAERARVRQSLPMVAVPELPDDPAQFVACIANAGYFEAVAFTDEDRDRSSQYRENIARQASESSAQSLDDYLQGLEMQMQVGTACGKSLDRITQLINKTNQFNTTTIRRSIDEMRSLAADRSNIVLHYRLSDRFGDNGIVSVVVMRPTPGEHQTLEIESWVMSCRVFGRGLEYEILNSIVSEATTRGVRALTASYVPTQKNGLIEELYPKLGFTQESRDTDGKSGETAWRLHLDSFTPSRTYIRMSEESHG